MERNSCIKHWLGLGSAWMGDFPGRGAPVWRGTPELSTAKAGAVQEWVTSGKRGTGVRRAPGLSMLRLGQCRDSDLLGEKYLSQVITG